MFWVNVKSKSTAFLQIEMASSSEAYVVKLTFFIFGKNYFQIFLQQKVWFYEKLLML